MTKPATTRRPSAASTLYVRAAASLVMTSIPRCRVKHAASTAGDGKTCVAPVPSSTSSGCRASSASRCAAAIVRASDTGQSSALAATVVRPDAKVKEEWLGRINDLQTKLPFSRIRTAMESMYPASQNKLGEQTAAQRLAQLPVLDKAAGPVFMRSYNVSMIPAACTADSVQRLAKAAEEYKDLSAGTRRALLVAHQEDARCVAIRKAITVPLS